MSAAAPARCYVCGCICHVCRDEHREHASNGWPHTDECDDQRPIRVPIEVRV